MDTLAGRRLAYHTARLREPRLVMEAMKDEGFSPLTVREAIEELSEEGHMESAVAIALRGQLSAVSVDVPRQNPPVDGSYTRIPWFGKKKVKRQPSLALVDVAPPKAVKVRCPITGFVTDRCALCSLYGGLSGKTVNCTAKKGATYSLVADGPMPVAPADTWNTYVASQQTIRSGGRRFITIKAQDGD